jgi:hypothetical protein
VKTQKAFIETQIKHDYAQAVAQEEKDRVWRVFVFEEAEIVLGKQRSQTMLQFCSIGRNFKLSYLAVAQRLAMLNTDLISLSGQLYCGCLHEENDLKKLRNWLKDRTEKLKRLSLGDFIRYCDGDIAVMHVDKFSENVDAVNAVSDTPKIEPFQPIKTHTNSSNVLARLTVVMFGFALLLYALGQMI